MISTLNDQVPKYAFIKSAYTLTELANHSIDHSLHNYMDPRMMHVCGLTVA